MIDYTFWFIVLIVIYFLAGTICIRNVIVNYRNYKFYAVGRNVMTAIMFVTMMICTIVKMLWR